MNLDVLNPNGTIKLTDLYACSLADLSDKIISVCIYLRKTSIILLWQAFSIFGP